MKSRFLILPFFFLVACNSHTKIKDSQIQGLWKLVHFEAYNEQNKKWQLDSQRIGHTGYLIYDGLGHMAIHLIPHGYNYSSKQVDSLSEDSLKKQFSYLSTNYVYFGNYLLSDSTVSHTKLSATDVNDIGKKSIRFISFQHDTLCLITSEKVKGKKLKLSWVKEK